MKNLEGGALFTFFMIYANVWFIYLSRWQGCANEHFNKAVENATETEINKKPSYPFSFALMCHILCESKLQIFKDFFMA